MSRRRVFADLVKFAGYNESCFLVLLVTWEKLKYTYKHKSNVTFHFTYDLHHTLSMTVVAIFLTPMFMLMQNQHIIFVSLTQVVLSHFCIKDSCVVPANFCFKCRKEMIRMIRPLYEKKYLHMFLIQVCLRIPMTSLVLAYDVYKSQKRKSMEIFDVIPFRSYYSHWRIQYWHIDLKFCMGVVDDYLLVI